MIVLILPFGTQALWCAYVEEQILSCQNTSSWWKYRFHTDSKVHGHSKVIMLCDTSSHSDTLKCQIYNYYAKGQNNCVPNTKLCHKPFNLFLRLLVSCMYTTHCLMVISMCQIWCANVNANRSKRSDTKTYPNLKIWSWGQRPTLYQDYEYSRHTLLWWCAKMVCQCQRKRNIAGWT